MCRFPEDVMRRISFFVQNPLPTPDQSDVTWEHLNQKGLSTMMRVCRMIYSIAGPMLYKEVVVNNFASFFLGVDDPVREHHQGCTDHPTTQTRLCHLVQKKDGTGYNCPRHGHPHQIDNQVDHFSSATSTPFALYHKQELLALVEAIHVVYATPDKHIFQGFDSDQVPPAPNAVSALLDECDTRRYTDHPDCIENFPQKNNPLVKLRRMTVGCWMGYYWNQHSLVDSDWWEWNCANDALMAFSQFERYLGLGLPEIGPRFVCRYPTLGPLSRFPEKPCNIDVNVLHDPDLLKYGSNLVVGAINVVDIGSLGASSARDNFMEHVSMIATGLADALDDWTELHTSAIVAATMVTFAVYRDSPSNGLEAVGSDEDDDAQIAMYTTFRRELHDRLGPGEELSLSWRVCWAEVEGDCPVCQPATCSPDYITGIQPR